MGRGGRGGHIQWAREGATGRREAAGRRGGILVMSAPKTVRLRPADKAHDPPPAAPAWAPLGLVQRGGHRAPKRVWCRRLPAARSSLGHSPCPAQLQAVPAQAQWAREVLSGTYGPTLGHHDPNLAPCGLCGSAQGSAVLGEEARGPWRLVTEFSSSSRTSPLPPGSLAGCV